MMRVLHVISCLVKSDGHSQFCLELAERMTAQGMEHEIFSLPSEDRAALPDPKGLVHYATGWPLRVLNVSLPLGLESQFTARVRNFKPDVIHLHGGWHPVLFFAARVARRVKIPLLLSLHGSLRPAVMEGDRRWKKRLAWLAYQRRLVEMANVIHVSTDAEQQDLARFGFDKPGVVVPSAVSVEGVLGGADKDALAQRWPECAGKRCVLFLSRIHPLKGLDVLVAAWARLAGEFPDWHVLIAGPDEGGYAGKLQRRVRQTGLATRVTCCGPLYGADKMCALQSADLFVLPTRSENFGLVVAEALAVGVPVITTKGAPWEELLGQEGSNVPSESTNVQGDSQVVPGSSFILHPSSFVPHGRCGWWIDLGVDSLTSALREAMGLTAKERRAMGENGRRLVQKKYAWPALVQRMGDVYARLAQS